MIFPDRRDAAPPAGSTTAPAYADRPEKNDTIKVLRPYQPASADISGLRIGATRGNAHDGQVDGGNWRR
jgi:hypothetical protein